MPNTFKYSLNTEPQSLKKGNFWIGTGDVGKGPTSSTGFWNGIDPLGGQYVIYVNKSSGGPSIRVASGTNEFVRVTNQIANANYTTREQCIEYFSTQNDKLVLTANIPPVITDGISMYLDPANFNSYALGSTWYDLASGLSFTAQGGVLSRVTLGSGIGFSFNGSGYWQCSSNYNLVDLGGDCTIIMWVYNTVNPHSDRKTIFQKNGTVYASYEQEIAVTWEVGTEFSWYSRQNLYDYASTPTVGSSGWRMVGIKMSTGKTSAPRTGFYSMDGSSWVSNYYSRSSTPLVAASDIVIGSGYAGTVSQGGLGMVMCYNRMLSDSEISRTYNATKSLYGL